MECMHIKFCFIFADGDIMKLYFKLHGVCLLEIGCWNQAFWLIWFKIKILELSEERIVQDFHPNCCVQSYLNLLEFELYFPSKFIYYPFCPNGMLLKCIGFM